MPALDPSAAHKNRIFTAPQAGSQAKRECRDRSKPAGRDQGNLYSMWMRRGGDGNRRTYLGGEDGEVDAGEALEVLLEEALGVVLPDLLARHGDGEAEFGLGRSRCWTGRTGWSQAPGVPGTRSERCRKNRRWVI
jgi:hypothetical protein